MKTTVEAKGQIKEVTVEFHNVMPAGYGHYSINGVYYTSIYDKKKIKITTSDMQVIDAYKSAISDDNMDVVNTMKADFEEQLSDTYSEAIVEYVLDLIDEENNN